MNKELTICFVCVAVLGAGWLGTTLYQKQQVEQAAKIEQVRKSSYAKAMEEARATAKAVADNRAKDNADAGLKPGQPAAGTTSPTAPAASPEVETFLASAKLTGVMLGEPSIAIINKKEYEPGAEITLPNGRRLRVQTIAEESVTFFDGTRVYRLARK